MEISGFVQLDFDTIAGRRDEGGEQG